MKIASITAYSVVTKAKELVQRGVKFVGKAPLLLQNAAKLAQSSYDLLSKQLRVIDIAALASTTVVGYVLLPISSIFTSISTYMLINKANYLKHFSAKVKHVRDPELLRKCLFEEMPKLKQLSVIADNSLLEIRILQSTKDELIHIKKRLKDRIREEVSIQAIHTSTSIAGVACAIIGIACPPAIIPIAFAGLGIGAIGLANFIYAKCIPKGDILPTEKRMFYARVIKAMDALALRVTSFVLKLHKPALS